eukprot:INCI10787.1.p1 GENE.INCI10787.1~~INCI10787.1.p1  ORF type:complete len:283 (+),score=45.18 INCI10787.1:172-1020(+)
MAENKVASVEGGLVSSSGLDRPSAAEATADPSGGGKDMLSVGGGAENEDEDTYETDEKGELLLNEAGLPIRLPPKADPLPLYRKVMSSCPVTVGKSKSRKERIKKELTSPNLAYGEVTFELMQAVFAELRKIGGILRRKTGHFVDLGSGLGKPVFAAALLHEFKKCTGIEVLNDLHEASLDAFDIWETKCADQLRYTPEVELLLGDIAEVPWQDATVLFINMTTFTEQLIETIKEAAEPMKRGTVCITVTKQFHSKAWEVVHSSEQALNWGKSHVYIHMKVL